MKTFLTTVSLIFIGISSLAGQSVRADVCEDTAKDCEETCYKEHKGWRHKWALAKCTGECAMHLAACKENPPAPPASQDPDPDSDQDSNDDSSQ